LSTSIHFFLNIPTILTVKYGGTKLLSEGNMFELLFSLLFLFITIGILIFFIKLMFKVIVFFSSGVIFLLLAIIFFPALFVLFIVGLKLLVIFALLIPLILGLFLLKLLILPFC
jgi:hypothetical protein